MSAIVQFDHVHFAYNAGADILSDLNLTFEQGQFYFVTGASGAGKTSLLKMIYMALRPYRGSVRIFGEDVMTLPERYIPSLRRRIGIVFQDFRLVPELNVFDNIALPLRLDGRKENFIHSTVGRILVQIDLPDKAFHFPETLSGGEQQRIAIARALIRRPEILVADEPTGNIDDGLAASILHLLSALSKRGMTVIMATHDLHLLDRVPHAKHIRLGTKGNLESVALLDQWSPLK
ncbi:cell division transport system ATP-binding protein [Zymomonas mobilis]|uniref:cell division ATP-binding protein FtsE n=1 Tax=Zymomonas mobilis TaxID=542 RepID=UPI00026D87F9|nr:cell division ATP-binding protein FtsE [Zymomonas mobilis]AFN56733.1 cell division ATP-binding protein FtsE [Zymomonas mobilis subsp. mobilis ATCC 29191]TQK77836.1 cell division transport system ATP-binding protein [Zymomonas mobilis]TQL15518.1 cell division transport system ATP-binding protein [Zymomonas mobilis]GEB87086.1 cell division ATP-binding protein FtsE [Zymomonas mobilis subsp. mobilis]